MYAGKCLNQSYVIEGHHELFSGEGTLGDMMYSMRSYKQVPNWAIASLDVDLNVLCCKNALLSKRRGRHCGGCYKKAASLSTT